MMNIKNYMTSHQINLRIHDHDKDAAPIIFLHFSGANLMMWQPALPYFQDRYRLILVDLRGHGQSTSQKVAITLMRWRTTLLGL